MGLNVWICSPKTEAFRAKYLSKSKGPVLCVLYCFFFFTDSMQFSIIDRKIVCIFFKYLTWTRPHWEATPAHATSPIFFSSVTKPLQSWPLWPSWQLWAQICRSSWRLRIGSNVCKRCSLGLDIILFFSLQLYNTSILSWEVQFSEKSQHCSNSEHQNLTKYTRVLDTMA